MNLTVHRFLEEGKIEETDKLKDEIEDMQRERRKALSNKGEDHVPRFFRYVAVSVCVCVRVCPD